MVGIIDAVMTDIHTDLESASFIEPEGIKKVAICRESGKRSIEGCANVYTELFIEGTVPDTCDGHSKMVVCKDSGMLPNEFCPVHEERIYAYMPEKERNATWSSKLTIKNPDGTEVPMNVAPTERCTMHTQPVGCTHTWSDWAVQSHNPNVEERRCTLCNSIEYREKQKETQPTTNTVQTSHTCKFTTYTLKQAATCDKEGSEVSTCDVVGCGKTYTRVINVKGHKEGAADNLGNVKCSVCGKVLKEHKCTFGTPIVKTQPTCKDEGKQVATCTTAGCGKTQESSISKTAHTAGAAAANGEVKCTVCGTVMVAGSEPEPTDPPQEGGENPMVPPTVEVE